MNNLKTFLKKVIYYLVQIVCKLYTFSIFTYTEAAVHTVTVAYTVYTLHLILIFDAKSFFSCKFKNRTKFSF